MDFDFSVNGEVKITMVEYIKKPIKDFHVFNNNKLKTQTLLKTPAHLQLF